jgi:hypothetical protein
MNNLKKWSVYSLASVTIGCCFGYGLLWVWFFVSLAFFRSGDSGPSWINTANDVVLYGGIVVGVATTELLFIFHKGRRRDMEDDHD